MSWRENTTKYLSRFKLETRQKTYCIIQIVLTKIFKIIKCYQNLININNYYAKMK